MGQEASGRKGFNEIVVLNVKGKNNKGNLKRVLLKSVKLIVYLNSINILYVNTLYKFLGYKMFTLLLHG